MHPESLRRGIGPGWTRLLNASVFVLGLTALWATLIFDSRPHGHPSHVRAQYSATELRSGIMLYYTEYKRFPDLPVFSPGRDNSIETEAANGLISVLIPMRGNLLADSLNRRQVACLSDRIAKSPASPGIWRDGTDASLRDPWGHPFLVVMDTNYDNEITLRTEKGLETIYTQVAVISLGPDGLRDGTPGSKNDDIYAR